VILLGSTGCTGKTLFAHQLMKETNVPYFPLDHLMMALYRDIPSCGFTPLDDQWSKIQDGFEAGMKKARAWILVSRRK
jgi:hypothetical protein